MALAQERADLVSCSSSVTDPHCHSREASQRAARPSLQEWHHSHPHSTSRDSSYPISTHSTLTMRSTKADCRKYGKVPEILFLSGYLSVLWSSHEPETYCSNFYTLVFQLVPNKLQTLWQRQTGLRSM